MIDHCLMTGAGSGIGQATALRMAEHKVPLLLVGRPGSLDKTRDLVSQRGGFAEVFSCDLENHALLESSLPSLIAAKGAHRWGVVLAASILGPAGEDCTLDAYEQTFRINVIGNLAVLNACIPPMLKAGCGRIVFFAGGGAAYAYPAFPAYALSKVSTVRLAENLAVTHPPKSGLSFVCLAPGAVDTPMLAKVVAAGGSVKTKTNIAEPVDFILSYCASDSMALSGRYIHVRDNWAGLLSGKVGAQPEQFLLRRIS